MQTQSPTYAVPVASSLGRRNQSPSLPLSFQELDRKSSLCWRLMLQNLAEEQLGSVVTRAAEKRVGRALLDDLTGVHEDNAVGYRPCEPHFVRHAHHGHAVAG